MSLLLYVLVLRAVERLIRRAGPNAVHQTDSLLHLFVDDLVKEINSRPRLRNAFNFSEISNGQFSNLGRNNADLHA